MFKDLEGSSASTASASADEGSNANDNAASSGDDVQAQAQATDTQSDSEGDANEYALTTLYSTARSRCCRYPSDGDLMNDLDGDDDAALFDEADAASAQGKQLPALIPPLIPYPTVLPAATDSAGDIDLPLHGGGSDQPYIGVAPLDASAPPVAGAPDAADQGLHSDDDIQDSSLPPLLPLPEEEPELIGTPKAPRVEVNHDAPLHANTQSLFKSLRGWLFGDSSDSSGDGAYSSANLRNRDAVLAHAMRVEGWKQHKEHFTGAAFTGSADHLDQQDK